MDELKLKPPPAPSLYNDDIYRVHYMDTSINLVEVGEASLIARETNLEDLTFWIGVGKSLRLQVQAVYDDSPYDDIRFYHSEYYNFRLVKVCDGRKTYNVSAYRNNFECMLHFIKCCPEDTDYMRQISLVRETLDNGIMLHFIKCCPEDTDYMRRISLVRETLDNGIMEWVFTFESESHIVVKAPLDTKKIVGFMWKHLELNISHVQEALDAIIEWKISTDCYNEVLYQSLFSKYVLDLEKLKQWREKLNFQV